MSIKIALAGNPNSGKTTLFNTLTGSTQYVGNWPGVTVEKKEGKVKGRKDVVLVDLPGIYSLSPYTLEEVVSRNYLIEEKPELIIDIVDATNIERNLYLTTQLIETGVPLVIALNMIDIARKNGEVIDVAKLSAQLGVPVIETSALRGEGVNELIDMALSLYNEKTSAKMLHKFSPETEEALDKISAIIAPKTEERLARWYTIKFFERDKKAGEEITMTPSEMEVIDKIIIAQEERYDDDSESIIIAERYDYITNSIVDSFKRKELGSMSISDKIDAFVTNKWLALPIFVAVMGAVYYLAMSTIGTIATDWVNETLFGDIVPNFLIGLFERWNVAALTQSLLLDGVLAGVGAVLGFLPQMIVLFILLALLEDCGYMSRIAFIMDRMFRRFGLSGKSFIPMLITTGCGVPGIMATRTIESDRDRRMTIMTTTFVPCGAKLPIIAMMGGAMFGGAWWVSLSMYFGGIMAVVLSGIILKKTRMFAGEVAPFVMELPSYHLPSAKNVFRHTLERSVSFVKKAGTVILVSACAIWFLSTFSFNFSVVEDTADSMLAIIGSAISPIFAPLGWGDWKNTVATILGLVAKENVVGTFGILYGMEVASEAGNEIWPVLQASFTQSAAYSFLLFNMFCAPCFAAIGAIKREMNSGKWTFFAIAYQTLFAYLVSLCFYQISSLITTGAFGIWTIIAIIVLLLTGFLLFRPNPNKKKLQRKVAASERSLA